MTEKRKLRDRMQLKMVTGEDIREEDDTVFKLETMKSKLVSTKYME